MTVQEHSGNEKSCVWHAPDFADGELKDEMFCIRFASVDSKSDLYWVTLFNYAFRVLYFNICSVILLWSAMLVFGLKCCALICLSYECITHFLPPGLNVGKLKKSCARVQCRRIKDIVFCRLLFSSLWFVLSIREQYLL